MSNTGEQHSVKFSDTKSETSTENARSSHSKSEKDDTSAFCTASNLASCVLYLSQELQNLGLQYKLIESNGGTLNLVNLVNSCWEVIQLYHSSVRDGNTLFDQRCRDNADISHLHGNIRDLRSQLESKEKQASEYLEKERQTNSINKALATKLKSEKDEARRLGSVLQQKEAHHQHEMRKKEAELKKLKERLLRLVSGERGSDSRMTSMNMSEMLNQPDRARGKWRTDNATIRHEEELYRRVFGQYEAWVGQLSEENDLLKDFLSSTSAKMASLASKCADAKLESLAQDKDILNGSLSCSLLSSDTPEEEHLLSLDFRNVKDHLQKQFDDNVRIMELALAKEEKDGHSPPPESDSCLEKSADLASEHRATQQQGEVLDQGYSDLKRQMKKLQRERELFAAAAAKLSKEKASFEAEKVELLRSQFIEELPSSLSGDPKEPFTPNTSLDGCDPRQSLQDLYGDSPRVVSAVPTLTSPRGEISHVNYPLTIGPAHLSRHHRRSKMNAPSASSSCHTPTGRSAPATRNPSLTRVTSQVSLGDKYASRTLDRPSRTGRQAHLLSRSKVKSESRDSLRTPGPLSRKPSENDLSAAGPRLPDNASMSQSINCPPVQAKSRHPTISRLGSADRPGSREHLDFEDAGPGLAAPGDGEGIYLSYDSGFCHDVEEASALDLRNSLTNTRLNALENSLLVLLKQIEARNRQEGTSVPRDGCDEEPTKEESEPIRGRGGSPKQKQRQSLTSKLSSAAGFSRHSNSCNRADKDPHKDKGPTPSGSERPAKGHLSTPTSLACSRKSSKDLSSNEDYFKRIQHNLAKFHWK